MDYELTEQGFQGAFHAWQECRGRFIIGDERGRPNLNQVRFFAVKTISELLTAPHK